jgi:hypothetical protein
MCFLDAVASLLATAPLDRLIDRSVPPWNPPPGAKARCSHACSLMVCVAWTYISSFISCISLVATLRVQRNKRSWKSCQKKGGGRGAGDRVGAACMRADGEPAAASWRHFGDRTTPCETRCDDAIEVSSWCTQWPMQTFQAWMLCAPS